MKVYVVTKGCYESSYTAGVYASPEAAMAAHPVPDRPIRCGPGDVERAGGWQRDADGESWDNGLDWDDAADISAFEVKE